MSDDQLEDKESDGLERPGRDRAARLLSFGGLLFFLGLMQFIWAQFQYHLVLAKYHGDSALVKLDPGYVFFHFRRMGLGLMGTAAVVIFVGLFCKQSRSRHWYKSSFDTPSEASTNFDFLAGDATPQEGQEP